MTHTAFIQGPVSLKPCRSPYCECTIGQCSHPGFYDARQETVAWMHNTDIDDLVAEFESTPEGADAMKQGREWLEVGQRVQEPDAYGYAKRLAVAIWEQHYKDVAPQWKPLDDLIGVLTQIDNMTAWLITPPAAQRPWVGLTGQQKELIERISVDVFDAMHRTEAKLKEKNT